jgi:hypothetical protein
VKEELKAAETAEATTVEEKPVEPSTIEETVATPLDEEALAPTGTTDVGAAPVGEEVVPVEGQGEPAPVESETGGTPLPPPSGETQSDTGQLSP